MIRVIRAASGVVAAVALAACGIAAPSLHSPGEDSSTVEVAPDLAGVTALADPRDWTGATTALVAPDPLTPVAEDVEPDLPAVVIDAQGTEVVVTDTRRILALDVYGTLARTVFELGLGDFVVGRDISTTFPEAADLPLVTQTGHGLAAEAILSLDPTVILADTSLGPWDVVLQMRDAGIPVVVVDGHRGLDNLGSLTQEVAAALGVAEVGRLLAERVEAEVAAVTAAIADVAPRQVTGQLRTIFLYVRGQSGVYYLFGEGTGATSLIEALGLYDVAAEIEWTGMKPVTDEAIVAAQPDLVLMMSGGLDSVGGVTGLLDRLPALSNTPAGENHRFVDMADSQILGFGPQTAAVLNALAVAVYAPEAVS